MRDNNNEFRETKRNHKKEETKQTTNWHSPRPISRTVTGIEIEKFWSTSGWRIPKCPTVSFEPSGKESSMEAPKPGKNIGAVDGTTA